MAVKRVLLCLAIVAILVGCSPAKEKETVRVVRAFQEAGLEAEGAEEMPKDKIGNAEYGMSFLMLGVCDECDGRVLVYASHDAAQGEVTELNKRKQEAAERGETTDWGFTRGNVIVLLHYRVPEDVVQQYVAVMRTLEFPE